MGCVFCATGAQGYARNLFPGEIVDQVLIAQRDFGERVSNVVLMGQGEPFANYKNVIAALRIMNHPKLLNIGARHITISTCGVIDGIKKLEQEPEQFTLAISLHAALQDVRNSLIPAMSNQRLDLLKGALDSYTQITHRRFSFEYSLINGINDRDDDLNALIDYCAGMLCHINLIPLNAIASSPYQPSKQATISHWRSKLEEAGIAASVRKSRGQDIAGACGQLIVQRGK